MATKVTWPGSASFFPGDTPFGIYDTDTTFVADAENTAEWCAKRLGYPTVDIEMNAIQFFACFEESVSEYSSQVNRFNIKDNLLSMQGISTASSLTHRHVESTGLNSMIRLSKQYGTEAGSGGEVTWFTGSVAVNSGSQVYDLTDSTVTSYESGTPGTDSIEVKRVFFQQSPAITRFFDPYLGSGYGTIQQLSEFGFQNYSPAVNYLMMPIYDDLLRIEAIEMNDMVRRSAYSFELINNKLRIFPQPQATGSIIFQYIKITDRNNKVFGSTIHTSDFSDINYDCMTYKHINSPGRQWIRKYTLALAKELLGEIRSKYGSLPTPGGDVSLDGDTLRTEASAEKENLIAQLREDLEQASKRNLMERQKEIAEFQQESINKVPLNIYIG